MKILDFGVAKILASPTGASSVKTRTGSLMGTPLYMSPEQCKGAGMLDHRTDIYSLGVILFEMMSGRPPFNAEGVGELFAKHMLEDPPQVTDFAPQRPAAHGRGDHEVAGEGSRGALPDHGGLPQGDRGRGQGDRAAGVAGRHAPAVEPGVEHDGADGLVARDDVTLSSASSEIDDELALKPKRTKLFVGLGGGAALLAVGYFAFFKEKAPPPAPPVATTTTALSRLRLNRRPRP